MKEFFKRGRRKVDQGNNFMTSYEALCEAIKESKQLADQAKGLPLFKLHERARAVLAEANHARTINGTQQRTPNRASTSSDETK